MRAREGCFVSFSFLELNKPIKSGHFGKLNIHNYYKLCLFPAEHSFQAAADFKAYFFLCILSGED